MLQPSSAVPVETERNKRFAWMEEDAETPPLPHTSGVGWNWQQRILTNDGKGANRSASCGPFTATCLRKEKTTWLFWKVPTVCLSVKHGQGVAEPGPNSILSSRQCMRVCVCLCVCFLTFSFRIITHLKVVVQQL